MQDRILGILRKRWADISANVFGMVDKLLYGRSKEMTGALRDDMYALWEKIGKSSKGEDKMKIRQAEARDWAAIYEVVRDAFSSAEHADGNEQDLVNALRKGEAFIPKLSLVAEENGKIIGHIMFTKAKVGTEGVLALAPLSVLPAYQRQGVGSALIRKGHEIAQRLGYNYVVVLGSEKYYPGFGYIEADTLGIKAPFDVPRENFMAYKIRDEAAAVHGVMEYAKEFGI